MKIKVVSNEFSKTYDSTSISFDPYQIMEEDAILMDGKLLIVFARAFDFEKDQIVFFVETDEERHEIEHWGM